MRRLLAAAVLVLAAAAAVILLVSPQGPRHGADRVKHLIDWDDSCASVEMETDRRAKRGYAATWASTVEVAHMACEYLGDTAFYARFPSAAARRREVATSPPFVRICQTPGEVEYDRELRGGPFRLRCARKHGLLDEQTYRYCAAGREIVVDGFFEDRDFRELCAKLRGHLAQAPSAMATQ